MAAWICPNISICTELDQENQRLKHMFAELSLRENRALKDVIEKSSKSG